ncbi:pyridoxamine 5'-phosphate oxidase family protein [Actinomadura parmotrematis]|uniref:TIGR03618 family F420-dependent PPOX class oxidoreductase n=1 Tax=Actinomadura parmotrematis TaxID=2864039 RepID=A0ABS7FP52_9ACTN|nr:TIGR03618 family F420-dependent PPOX class oxidoreductase [Actinomadura parmotrematis]MBW8482158.1 TIGR03618 family F420-dependent PPOX class oxidoreductase [Actinomadura parmotrematis]
MQRPERVDHRLPVDDERLAAFWRERHLCLLTTLRPDGTPHVVPVGATLDPAAGVARVITSRGTVKARNAAAGGPVAVAQVDGRRWASLEGRARVLDDPAAVADAERRYAERYREPRPNPERVVIEITIDRVIGSV